MSSILVSALRVSATHWTRGEGFDKAALFAELAPRLTGAGDDGLTVVGERLGLSMGAMKMAISRLWHGRRLRRPKDHCHGPRQSRHGRAEKEALTGIFVRPSEERS